jgi:hypothetical protein
MDGRINKQVEHTGDLDNQLIVRVIDGNQNK